MPGFISNVNNSIHVSIGFTHFYYLSFLAGFCISATVFIALHHFFPPPEVKDFVLTAATHRQVMAEYQHKWDVIGEGRSGSDVPGENVVPKDVQEVDGFPKAI